MPDKSERSSKGPRHPAHPSPHSTWLAIATVLPSLAVVAALISSTGRMVLWYAVGVNLTALLLYGHDKSAARKGAGRVPELVLHLCALAGGTPAALLAGRTFRHKTRKRRFLAVYWATVALHLALAAWGAAAMLSARGANGTVWTAFACGVLAAINVAAFILEPRRRRGPARTAGAALIVLGGALGATIRDQRGGASAWLPYLAGSAQLAAALWPVTVAVRACLG